jgi:glycerol-3-phosphate dehydrogenase (NAD(P)+)
LNGKELKVAVIGAGSWGSVVATLLADKVKTVIWTRTPEVAESINCHHLNPSYLGPYQLSKNLLATCDLEEASGEADILIIAIPAKWISNFFDSQKLLPKQSSIILSLTKGLEPLTGMRVTEIFCQKYPELPIGVLTGPNLAQEVLAGQPSASVVAFNDDNIAKVIQELLVCKHWRLYRNNDVLGCEIAGAAKNVLAIASGIVAGLGLGANTQAALITRSLAELSRLGVAMGGNSETFSGLAGLGDLLATCMSDKSRNRQVGFALAKGEKLVEFQQETKMVAEGITTAKPLLELAELHGIEMPVAEQVKAVLFDSIPTEEAILSLMSREIKSEYKY